MNARRVVVAAWLLVPAAPALAQQPNRLKLSEYLEFEDAQNPRLSPDGKQVVYT